MDILLLIILLIDVIVKVVNDYQVKKAAESEKNQHVTKEEAALYSASIGSKGASYGLIRLSGGEILFSTKLVYMDILLTLGMIISYMI